MKYKEFGGKERPTIILLHGERLSWWSFMEVINQLEAEYHVVTPIIDGHGEDGETTFISIQDSAQKLIRYIDENMSGKVMAICGFALGGQIAMEVLSGRPNIAKYAVIESTLITPATGINRLIIKSSSLYHGLFRNKWIALIQARTLGVKSDQFDQFYNDSQNISKDSLSNITKSNISYTVPDTIKDIKAKILIIFGSKEIRMMDKSVRKLMKLRPQTQVCIISGMKHKEFSLIYSLEYLTILKEFMS